MSKIRVPKDTATLVFVLLFRGWNQLVTTFRNMVGEYERGITLVVYTRHLRHTKLCITSSRFIETKDVCADTTAIHNFQTFSDIAASPVNKKYVLLLL